MEVKTLEMLKAYREKAGLTRKKVADEIGCSISAISYWESGKRHPDADTFITLMRLYNVRGAVDLLTDYQNVESKLTETEWELVNLFRASNYEGQRAAVAVLRAFKVKGGLVV